MLYGRKDKLFALELKKKALQRDKWLYYTGKAPQEVYTQEGSFNLKIMKQDVPMFIDADEAIQKIEIQIYKAKQELEFIQKTLEEINRRSFHITNAIKVISFLHGQN